ncbi:MAG: hypothetical protein HC831_15745 [Chloroflexia bacterium]|nr:hypothetical protein [Chloroflexia bacterium]
MDYIKSNYNIISTALFVLAIVVAHIFSTNNYDWTKTRLATWVHKVMTEN